MTEQDKKKIKYSALDGDRLIWRIMGGFADLFYISMLWFICSLPVITLGMATTAAYDAVVHCVRRREPGILYRFLSTFKNEWRNGAVCTLVWAAVCAAWVLLLLYIPTLGDGGLGFLFMVNAVVLGVVVLGTLTWMFPVLSRFQMGAGRVLLSALKLTFAHLPVTLLMSLATVLTAAACAVWLFPLLVLPGLLWLLQSVFIEKVFTQLTET